MKERPILFSAPMVRAILAGTKTQTRRKMRSQPRPFEGGISVSDGIAYWDGGASDCACECPYGEPGGRLWVRETWQRGRDVACIEGSFGRGIELNRIYYRADEGGPCGWSLTPWRPSIFMPREASRITLEVTGIRVERLQDIGTTDAIAEGAELAKPGLFAIPAYRAVWEDINGPRSWDANPWVWVIEFRSAS